MPFNMTLNTSYLGTDNIISPMAVNRNYDNLNSIMSMYTPAQTAIPANMLFALQQQNMMRTMMQCIPGVGPGDSSVYAMGPTSFSPCFGFGFGMPMIGYPMGYTMGYNPMGAQAGLIASQGFYNAGRSLANLVALPFKAIGDIFC